jgi:protein-disulfide isomerase
MHGPPPGLSSSGNRSYVRNKRLRDQRHVKLVGRSAHFQRRRDRSSSAVRSCRDADGRQSSGPRDDDRRAEAGPNGTGPSSFSPAQRSEIEGIIKSYLTQNPDVLIEVTKELEKRQAAMQAEEHKKVILEKKASIFKAPTDFVWGNPKGNVTVVEFFDYNCGWCKKAVDELTKLTKADPNVRVVFKELPIFGENSVNASKAAMASVRQGKYFEYHVALMKEKQVTKDNLFKIAEKVGLNVDKLKADMADPAIEAALKENGVIAAALGIEGTPGFIVDTKVNVGFIPAEGGNSITSLIGEVRKAGCQVC